MASSPFLWTEVILLYLMDNFPISIYQQFDIFIAEWWLH